MASFVANATATGVRIGRWKLACSIALVFSACAQAATFVPLDLKGTWRVDNNAEIIDVGDSEATYFDATSVSCIQTDRGPLDKLTQRFASVVSRQGDTLLLADHTGYQYRLTRLRRLPSICANGGTIGNDPVLNFEAFIAYFRENYAGDAARHLDWKRIHDEFRPRVTHTMSSDALWTIYAEIMHRFDDVHTFLDNGKSGKEERSTGAGTPSGLRKALLAQDASLGEDQGFARDAEVAPALNSLMLYEVMHGTYKTAMQGKFEWGWAAPDVGYLGIRQMSGLFAVTATDPDAVNAAVRETMRTILSDFRGARALIIDVRQNRGGSDDVAHAIASFFADRTVKIQSRTRTPDGFTDWRSIAVAPDSNAHFSKPVYLLISDNTVSAAEDFTALMREYPTVTLIGTTTRGAYSDILVKKLPDGSVLGLSDMQVLSPSGKNLETVGVAPDVRVESYRPECLITCYAEPVRVALRLAHAGRE